MIFLSKAEVQGEFGRTQKGERVSALSVRSSATLKDNDKNHRDGSSPGLVRSDGGPGQTHASRKKTSSSSVRKYSLLNFSTRLRNGKAPHCPGLSFFFLR